MRDLIKNQNYTIMKNFFLKLTFVASMFAMFALTSCELQNNKSFGLSVKEVGPEYVEVLVRGGDVVRMAYMIDTKQQLMNSPHQLFKNGTEVTVPGGEVLRISAGIKENTTHYLYAVAALSDTEFSEIITLPFTTTEYDLSELVTVVDQFYDGYKVRLTLPKETKDRGNAIRYNQCCIMMYNYMIGQGGADDYSSLLYNGQMYATNDTTIVFSEDTNWFETGEDSDGDGEIDWDKVKQAGVEFAIIRVGGRNYSGDGEIYEDTNANKNSAGARAAGIKVGVYFFAQAINPEEAREEAEFVLEAIKDWEIQMPVVYDWEYVDETARTAELDARTLTDCTIAFCETVQKAGYEPMIYFNRDQSHKQMYMEELINFGFWLAMYDQVMDYPYKIDMWQYSCTGSVPGIAGDVDMNLYFEY